MLKLLSENRRARLLSPVYKVEAGLVLTGSEVKALKEGSGSLASAYLKFFGGEPYLVGFKVGRYQKTSDQKFDPERNKKVLLKKKEIEKILGLTSQKGLVCLPSQIYPKKRFLKVELLVGRVWRKGEKREKEKKKEVGQHFEKWG